MPSLLYLSYRKSDERQFPSGQISNLLAGVSELLYDLRHCELDKECLFFCECVSDGLMVLTERCFQHNHGATHSFAFVDERVYF